MKYLRKCKALLGRQYFLIAKAKMSVGWSPWEKPFQKQQLVEAFTVLLSH